MRPKAIQGVLDAALQVLVKRLLTTGQIIIRGRFIKDTPIAGFFNICGDSQDQPEWIIIKIAAYVIITTFGQGLVLVISAAAGKLGGS